MYTLNTVEQHGVCVSGETTGPLMASGYQKNGKQEAMNGMYVVSVVPEVTPKIDEGGGCIQFEK